MKRCPYCGEDATEVEKTPGADDPHPGAINLSVCIYCLEVNIWEPERLRRPTADELEIIKRSRVWLRIQHDRDAVRKERGKPL